MRRHSTTPNAGTVLARPSVWHRIPPEVISRIALEVEHLDPLGPPSAHLALLTTCKHVHSALRDSSTFLTGVFRDRFDVTAAPRRYGPRVARANNLITQLKRNAHTLCTFRHRALDGEHHDETLLPHLWQVFLLLMEDDGKNRLQLEWAGVYEFVHDFVMQHRWDGPSGWPVDKPVHSLVLWIMWLMTDRDTLRALTEEQRTRMLDLTRPFVMMSMKYRAFHAPDNHFVVPLDEPYYEGHFPTSVGSAHGEWPHYVNAQDVINTVPCYGGAVKLATPLITVAARLLFVAVRELVPMHVPADLFTDRADAARHGQAEVIRPTQADIIEVNAVDHVRIRPRPDWDWLAGLSPSEYHHEASGLYHAPFRAPSARWDDEFMRLMYCSDVYHNPPEKGRIHQLGSLTGDWAGRFNIPSEIHYQEFMNHATMPPDFGDWNPYATTGPIYMRLAEHHAIWPEHPAPVGFTRDPADDGVNNGWFPEGVRFENTPSGATVHWQPRGGPSSRYERYSPLQPNSHDSATCNRCRPRSPEPAVADAPPAAAPLPSLPEPHDPADEPIPRPYLGGGYTDDRDANVRRPAPPCDGISDIILTGDTEPRHGMAWHFYHFHGRVRPWDGLITIVRQPYDHRQGRFIMRGYLVGGDTFVGTWRCHNADALMIPWEGTVVMSRVPTPA